MVVRAVVSRGLTAAAGEGGGAAAAGDSSRGQVQTARHPNSRSPTPAPACHQLNEHPLAPQMGPYQFKARVARLRLKGGDVRDFGERVLQQGAYGDDVMQLQVRWAAGGEQHV